MYKVGDVFKHCSYDDYWVLVSPSSGKVCLISLDCYERWSDPVDVDDMLNINNKDIFISFDGVNRFSYYPKHKVKVVKGL